MMHMEQTNQIEQPAAAEAEQAQTAVKRIHLIDEIRGADIILMVLFHSFYVAGWIFDLAWGRAVFNFFKPVESFFSGIFIFICGLSCWLSRSNVKRGLQIAAFALLISLTLWLVMPDQMIRFGILHFLASAVLLFALFKPLLRHVPVIPGILVCAVLLLLTWHLPVEDGGFFGIKGLFELHTPDFLVRQSWLYPLGIGLNYGVDYFPILPWIFCFLAGSFVGRWAKEGKFPAWTYKSRVPFFSWCGKHTLIIYLLHQPAAFALFWLGTHIWQLIAG